MKKTTATKEERPGMVANVEINVYMPDKLFCHVLEKHEAEAIDAMADKSEKMEKFIVDSMVKSLDYGQFKKGDVVFMSSVSQNYSEENAPKYIGVFKGFKIDRMLDDSIPTFHIVLDKAWTVGSFFMKLDGNVPNIADRDSEYSFIPDGNLYKSNPNLSYSVDYIRRPTDDEMKKYKEAFDEFWRKTYCRK